VTKVNVGDNEMKMVLFRVVLSVLATYIGVRYRSFWLSEWGPYAFILLMWVSMTLVLGWGYGGKPFSIRFGAICGSAFALMLLVMFYTNAYIGLGVFAALAYLGVKTKFFDRRFGPSEANTTEP
jgi:hypothetical protein